MNSTALRAISGGIYVLIVILAVSINTFTQAILLLFFLIVGQFELKNIFHKLGGYNWVFSLLVSTMLFLSGWLIDNQKAYLPILVFIPIVIFLFLTQQIFKGPSKETLKTISNSLLGTFYLGIPITMALLLKNFDLYSNTSYLLMIFIALWSNDTLAFIFGKWLGKNKLLESVSPNKTIEGFIGGIIGALVAATCMYFFSNLQLSIYQWLGFAIIVSFSGTLGDLFESLLKRIAKIKDSGKIMPGHGGILDRIDSFLFAVPFVYFYLFLLDLI